MLDFMINIWGIKGGGNLIGKQWWKWHSNKALCILITSFIPTLYLLPCCICNLSEVKFCLFCVLISILHVFEWSHDLCCVNCEQMKGLPQALMLCLILGTSPSWILTEDRFQKQKWKERRKKEGKEGRENVIELPWKISITYLLNQLYEVLSEKRPFGLQTIVSTARFHATFVYEHEIDLWRRKKRTKWRICVVIDPMAVLVRMHTIGQMWNPYYLI